jgi:hypothetical protein
MSRHTELDPQLVPPSSTAAVAVAVAVMEPLSVKRARPSVCLTGCVLVAGLVGVLCGCV